MDQVVQLTWEAYIWAAAGLCIGGAEITYFYLYGGIGSSKPMEANVIFRESLAPIQIAGVGCNILGVLLLYFGKGLALG